MMLAEIIAAIQPFVCGVELDCKYTLRIIF